MKLDFYKKLLIFLFLLWLLYTIFLNELLRNRLVALRVSCHMTDPIFCWLQLFIKQYYLTQYFIYFVHSFIICIHTWESALFILFSESCRAWLNCLISFTLKDNLGLTQNWDIMCCLSMCDVLQLIQEIVVYFGILFRHSFCKIYISR